MLLARRYCLVAVLVFLGLMSLAKSILDGTILDPLRDPFHREHSNRQSWNRVDWSQFAYVQYVTNLAYLCNSVMLFETLHRLGCLPDRLMMYPSHFSMTDNSTEARLLRKVKEEYNVILRPIEVQQRWGNNLEPADSTWADSYTKLLAFNQTDYARVLLLDSDSTVLQNMDELFLIKKAPVAMPRAYWLASDDRTLSSILLLLEPTENEFARVMQATSEASGGDYDMELLNTLYKDSAMVLPHRPYILLTGEFRGIEHSKYIGDPQEQWDPDAVFKETKYLHFSDWPLPKPWLAAPEAIDSAKPRCDVDSAGNQTTACRDQKLWVGAYTEWMRRREEICGRDVF